MVVGRRVAGGGWRQEALSRIAGSLLLWNGLRRGLGTILGVPISQRPLPTRHAPNKALVQCLLLWKCGRIHAVVAHGRVASVTGWGRGGVGAVGSTMLGFVIVDPGGQEVEQPVGGAVVVNMLALTLTI